MILRRLVTALVVGAVAGLYVQQWREVRRVHQRARSILYPGDPVEMAEVLSQLQWYADPQSLALARQLEDRLRQRGRRPWRRAH